MAVLGWFIGDVGAIAGGETETNPAAYVVKSWRTIDGLPQNSVMAIAQTADGYLWLGTRGGLARFDGVRFSTYGLADGLKAASIWCLAEDGQGGLWIGTLGGGLSRWRDGAISTLTTADGLAHNDVTALAPAEAGALWVGSKGGLQHLGPGGFTRVGEAEGIRSTVMALATDRLGGLWVATFQDGLFYCKGGRCEPVEGPPGQRRFLGYSLVVDTEGDVWVSIGDGMVLRRHAGEWTVFNEANGLPFSFVRCLAEGAPGEIWAASSEEGLYVFRAGRFHAVPGTEAAVRSVRMSRDGVIWVGTFTRGLSRLATARLREYPVGQENHRVQVNGLVEEPPGEFWVSTDGTGLHQGSLERLERVVVSRELERFPNLTAGLRMSDGALYFGGARVLLRREPTTGEIRKMSPTNNVTALCEGADGALWLGTREGQLLRWVDNTLHTVTNGTFPTLIAGLVRGPGSSLWVAATRTGLFRWEAGHVQQWTTREGLPTDAVRALHQDAAGTLWIGTLGGGLAWLQPAAGSGEQTSGFGVQSEVKSGQMHSVNSRQGLGDDFISQILEDDQGNLWLGCNLGIFRVSKRELQDVAAGRATGLHPLALGEADGMLVPECSGGFSPAGYRSQSGTLYFSTLLGVVAVDPARVGPPAGPPSVLIEEVTLDGKRLPLHAGALSLPPGPRELEIHYTAFNYAKPEHIRFRHRLEGSNEEWTEAGKARSTRYSRLRPGNYDFQLSAANQDGRWNETGTRLAFTVEPFYWQTIWFRVGGSLLLMGSGGGLVWWLVRARLRRAEERARVALELHEKQRELAHLSRVTMLGELGGSLAHELNQPLTAMVNNAAAGRRFIAKGRADLQKLDGLFKEVAADGRRADGILRGIRAMIRKSDEEHRLLDLNAAAAEIMRLVESDALSRHCALVQEFEPALTLVNGNQVQLQQVFLNLILNAMDAMDQKPMSTRRVIVRTERQADGQVRASVRDFGGGLPPEGAEQVFKPFFSMKRNGMGLGLAIARSIIEAHGGSIAAANAEGGGACFSFWLPALQDDEDSETSSPKIEGNPAA